MQSYLTRAACEARHSARVHQPVAQSSRRRRQRFAPDATLGRMRIALVSESFYPAVDGTTTTVRAVADRLVDTGHQVLVVAPGPGLRGLPGLPGGPDRPARPQRAGDGRAGRLRRRPRARRPPPGRWVAARSSTPAPSGSRRCWSSRRRSPSSAADYWRTADGPSGRRGAGHGAAGCAAGWPSWVWRRRSGRRAWTPGPSIRRCGTPTSARTGPGTARCWSGYVGGLRNRHDVRRLAELGSVRGTRLVVVGDGPQRRWLETRLPTARFLGPLGTGALASTLANLDVLVHPGLTETCCHALREAAASGVPVVAPAAGGATDVVRPHGDRPAPRPARPARAGPCARAPWSPTGTAPCSASTPADAGRVAVLGRRRRRAGPRPLPAADGDQAERPSGVGSRQSRWRLGTGCRGGQA